VTVAVEGGANAGSSFNLNPTVSITTSGTDRIIVVFIGANRSPDTVSVLSVTASGLTFTRRYTTVYNPTGRPQLVEFWWAYAAAQQTGTTITVAFDTLAPSDCVVSVAAFSGANLVSPFDPNGGLPTVQNQVGAGGTTTPTVSGVSTSNANTMLILFFASQDFHPTLGPPDGSWTQITYLHEGASADETCGWWYKNVSSPQSSISLTAPVGGWDRWLYGVDAITEPLPPPQFVRGATNYRQRIAMTG
jgi:hypothetical protein